MKRRKTLSPEKAQAREERRERFRDITKRIGAMTDDERAALAARLPLVMTCEGHPLSLRNNMVLAFQCATPCTLVGGFRQWLKHGRVVRKGEHGYTILFPRTPNDKKNGAHNGFDQASEDAAKAENNGKRERINFLTGTVFDISQTEELPKDEEQQSPPPVDQIRTCPTCETTACHGCNGQKPTLTIWDENPGNEPVLICAPPPTKRVLILDKAPPGGWTEADKVPEKHRKPVTPQVPALDGMSPLGITDNAGTEQDCMRCEETFSAKEISEFCPKCATNMNRIDIGAPNPAQKPAIDGQFELL